MRDVCDVRVLWEAGQPSKCPVTDPIHPTPSRLYLLSVTRGSRDPEIAQKEHLPEPPHLGVPGAQKVGGRKGTKSQAEKCGLKDEESFPGLKSISTTFHEEDLPSRKTQR